MGNSETAKGNNTRHKKQLTLLKLMREKPFNAAAAMPILPEIGGIDEPFEGEHHYLTTFLEAATEENNSSAVKFLFEHGSDPNMLRIEDGVCPLDDLMYPAEEKADNQERLEIAKLFLEYGADPNIMTDGETLYDYVIYEAFEHIGEYDRDYLLKFYLLLVAFGGGGKEYPKPELAEKIDLDHIFEYDFKFFRCEDGYHLEGHVFTPDGRDIGRV